MQQLWGAGRGLRRLAVLNAVGNGLAALPASIGEFTGLRWGWPACRIAAGGEGRGGGQAHRM